MLSKSYWKTRAAYAVIDSNTCVVASGKVHHWALSSYTAELFAILVAFASATGPCIIHTDSLTIVQQFQDLLSCSVLPHHLQHYAWWQFLFNLIEERGGRENSPLHIVWCPAHNWDHLPLECITDEMLGFKNLSRADLTNNRKADLVAKEQLEGYARRESLHASRVLCFIQKHHLWLAKLHKHLSEDSSNRVTTEVAGPDQAPEQPSLDHKALYPRWAWDAVFASYTTSSPAVGFDFSKYKGKIKEANWTTATSWMVQLKWQLGDSCSTSFLELAAQCFVDGLHFVPFGDEIESLKSIVTHLRATVAASLKLGAALCPGLMDYTASKCNGHRHPNGTIKGAKVFLSNKALHLLATGFEKGATAKLSSWAMLASSLLWVVLGTPQLCLRWSISWLAACGIVGACHGGAICFILVPLCLFVPFYHGLLPVCGGQVGCGRCFRCGTVRTSFGYVPYDFSDLCWCGALSAWLRSFFTVHLLFWVWLPGRLHLVVRWVGGSSRLPFILVHPCTCAACQVPRLDVSGLEWIKVPFSKGSRFHIKVQVPQGST